MFLQRMDLEPQKPHAALHRQIDCDPFRLSAARRWYLLDLQQAPEFRPSPLQLVGAAAAE
ncbi:hypothetical protein D3C83_41380 [compost metagenome]